MKARNKIMAGVLGAVSVLALTAASSYAAPVCCKSGALGTVTGTGSGHVNGTTLYTTRGVTLTCDTAVGTWNGTDPRVFTIPGLPDKDGMYAAALTAIATGYKVEFCVASATANANVNMIYVLNH